MRPPAARSLEGLPRSAAEAAASRRRRRWRHDGPKHHGSRRGDHGRDGGIDEARRGRRPFGRGTDRPRRTAAPRDSRSAGSFCRHQKGAEKEHRRHGEGEHREAVGEGQQYFHDDESGDGRQGEDHGAPSAMGTAGAIVASRAVATAPRTAAVDPCGQLVRIQKPLTRKTARAARSAVHSASTGSLERAKPARRSLGFSPIQRPRRPRHRRSGP